MASQRILELPEELNLKLKSLAELQQETNGVLLYPDEKIRDASGNTRCRIEALYMTGRGDQVHVQSDTQRMAVMNEFFNLHPEYRYVKWHTHCRGTGQQWFDKISAGDRESYTNQLREDPNFIGMMVSPTHTIVIGMDNPVLQVTPKGTTRNFEAQERIIRNWIEEAAGRIGHINLPPLMATQKRTN